MSIPDKFGRIVKHKMGELKDWFDQVDDEREARAEAKDIRKRNTNDAKQELEDAMTSDAPSRSNSTSSDATTGAVSRPPLARRTPEEISRGSSGQQSSRAYSSPSTPGGATNATEFDALGFHYRLLGLEDGADFAAVQSAYNKLAARCDPARFVSGSQEESQAREILQRLDASYKALRDVLDMTARRFDLLEFDAPSPQSLAASANAAANNSGNLEI